MNQKEFYRRLNTNPRPVIVDLWAPWCSPCKMMEPAFKTVSQKYAGQVDVLKINADESPEVLKALGVMGIPTVIAFAKGKQILRRTGVQSAEMLDLLFDSALNQRKPAVVPPAPLDRLVRIVLGIALIVLGWFFSQYWFFYILGSIALFSAFYDRCPVYRTIAPRIVALFNRSSG